MSWNRTWKQVTCSRPGSRRVVSLHMNCSGLPPKVLSRNDFCNLCWSLASVEAARGAELCSTRDLSVAGVRGRQVLGMSTVRQFPRPAGSAVRVSGQVYRVAVGIPTRGRPAILKETLEDLRRQTRPANEVFVVYTDPSDIDDAVSAFPEVRFLRGRGLGGSCSQRNQLIDAAAGRHDLIFIMDDDCYLQREYLQSTEQVFAADASVVATTGLLLANGATGPGLTGEYARSLLRGVSTVPTLEAAPPKKAYNTDGCNMAFRMDVLQQRNVRFDEAMPGYAWYEDIDFSRRLLPFGKVVMVPGAQAVHLGAKVGKTSGRRYGYSQVANPVHLARKGVVSWMFAVNRMGRNILANAVKSLRPEPYIDRDGRFRGNCLAIRDWVQGRVRPDRILEL